jgi:hypothetical protein
MVAVGANADMGVDVVFRVGVRDLVEVAGVEVGCDLC